jgi:hypothetical protein
MACAQGYGVLRHRRNPAAAAAPGVCSAPLIAQQSRRGGLPSEDNLACGQRRERRLVGRRNGTTAGGLAAAVRCIDAGMT